MRTLLLLLLLTAPVITVDSKMQCGPDEHEHGNICCRNCMSGQYVRKPCSENHGVGECEVCGDETYTSHSSGLTYCLPCTQCQKDQEVVANCTRTSNRQCQCKTGFYCESEDCEICRPCHSCPEGTVIRHPCNATTDTVCEEEKGKANGDSWLSITPVVRVVIVLAIVLTIILAFLFAYCLYCYYCKRREKPSEPGGPVRAYGAC
ncbi:tumor necrosis factor receptor superfamily member 26-like isoform X1 [Elephas maximus indicus]|uniref:tumor necrosis factor receptor superfamily member 26-like isoform X1 n=1 Tax=Elephas maximus indicus TaxID=99487 RepID=UPI0021171249|nr:tumor necrosis factor receptor superfamily member 26-like isoform X1 [Elephas maximus indicus]